MHRLSAWSVRPYLGCPLADGTLMIVHRAIGMTFACMNMD